ncbi:MAG: 6-phosphofructokinase [bacterium]
MGETSRLRRIGVLTGGGDAPGLNAVIRAVVKTAISRYEAEVFGFIDGFKGLVLGQARRLSLSDVSGLLPRGGTILGTTNRDNPFKFLVSENGREVYRDCSGKVRENLRRLAIEALIVIGGDGSLSIARDFADLGIPVVGVPKTIDNDLAATDVTFGFDTALTTATEAIDKLHTTAESHHRVMLLEVMGRYAGWIALQAGLAGGADVILIPEIPYRLASIGEKIRERQAHGKYFSIIVVAEGAKPVDGEMVVQKYVRDVSDPVRLGGIGNKVGEDLTRTLGVETRVTVLGHLQRGGSPTPFDRILATRYGVAAVDLAIRGEFGMMVALRTPEITAVPLAAAVREQKRVPPDGDLIHTARSVGICFGD